MSKTKKIAILAIIAMVLTLMPTALFAATADSDRLAGDSRIATALDIASATTWGTTVVLAPADDANLVDALAAAPLAGQENAPILLTFKGSLDPAVKAKITALGATKVYVVGAISDAVAAEVDAIANVSVEALKGAGRQATAAAVNAKLTSPAGTFVVGYDAVPDALSVASFAAKNKYAIVLANADGSVDSAALVGATKYIVGGTTKVKDIAGVTRLSGADRFATNADVASKLSYSYDRVYVANGVSLVDALAVAPLAAKYNAFVALASASDVAAASVVNAKLSVSSKVIAVGGVNAVSDAVKGKVAFTSTTPQTAAVTVKTYDDDTKGQTIEFTVNGQKADVNTLLADGWDIEFTSWEDKACTIEAAGYIADSTTGLLEDGLTIGEVYVKVELTKGSDVVTSSAAKISVKNLNLSATGISEYTLKNDAATDFVQTSTKLVVGESAYFTDITATIGSSSDKIEYLADNFKLKTSDESVISVADNYLYAETPGTATITLTYGSATKSITFTVVNDAREADKLRVKRVSDNTVITSLTFAGAVTTTEVDLKVEELDQYGDPMPGYVVLANTTSSYTDKITVTDDLGAILTVTGVAKGSSVLAFYDADGTKLGSLNVTFSDNKTVASSKLDLYKPATDALADAVVVGLIKSDFSTDNTLDLSDDKYIAFALNQFNSDNALLPAPTVLITSVDSDNQSKADVVLVTVNGNKVILEANATGTATIIVTDEVLGKNYTQRVTVVDNAFSIKSVSFKSVSSPTYPKKLTYKTPFTTTDTVNDPILSGITLNKAVAQEIRLDTAGVLYIDKDSNGTNDDDSELGYVVLSTVGVNMPAGDGLEVTLSLGDEGTVLWKVMNMDGDKVLASTSVKVEL